jgi:hypothetical protein
LLWPALGQKWKLRDWNSDQSYVRSFALFIGMGPFGLYLLLSAITGAKLSPGWGAPLWMFWPLLLLTCFEFSNDPIKLRWVLYRATMVATLFPIAFVAERFISPYVLQNWSHAAFPGQELGAAVQQAWHEEYATTLPWVGGDWWLAGNASFYSEDTPCVYGDLDRRVSPWASDEKLRTAGGVLVWSEDSKHPGPPADWQQRFPEMHSLGVIEIPYHTSAKVSPARFGMARVPPANQVELANKLDQPLRR